MADDVEQFRAKLDLPTLQIIDAVRTVIRASHSGLEESIKWNAPSYALAGEDRITLGIERKGGVRVVVHRGAKPFGSDGFSFEDRDSLARWPAKDRGVIIFRNEAEVQQRSAVLQDLISRWLAATA